uniref:RNA-dependent RNA polymerase n=1 Tax=Entomophthora muscae mitovirus 5 TaxID=2557978 RepID=A0A499WMK1_9VIRU|nr:TPA_inf: RNA-dependent RNA polymerase [Entomophthora muscae mitovirus 5]
MIKWFYPTVLSHNGISEDSYQRCFEAQMRWEKHRGRIWCADHSKLVKLCVLRYLEGRPLEEPAGLSMTKDKLPKVIPQDILDSIRLRDLKVISSILSVFSLTDSLKGGKPVDIKTITAPWSGSIPSDVEKWIPDFLDRWHIEPFDTDWGKYHFTLRAGPNGPALAGSLLDYQALTEPLKEKLKFLGGEYFAMKLDELEEWYTQTNIPKCLIKVFKLKDPKGPIKLAKLSVRDDSSCKSRIFGILDYFSQTVLYVIHSCLFDILRRMPTDMTFDQTKGLKSLRPDKGSSFHSIDLTAATDRFPVKLQTLVLAKLIGDAKAKVWESVLIDRDYYLKGKPWRYAVGQPMGAYSSWATFALTHHLVVYSAARRAGILKFSNYRILGDDIVIGNDQVAHHYREIMTQLGCGFSEKKTHVSPDFFEFSKRLVYQGQEFSIFPLSGLIEVVQKWHLLYEFLKQVENRGFEIQRSYCNPGLISDLLECFGKPLRLRLMYIRNMTGMAALPIGRNVDYETAGESARVLSRLFNISFSCNLSLKSLGRILSNHARDAYTWSQARSAEKVITKAEEWQERTLAILETDSGPLLSASDQEALLDQWAMVAPPLVVFAQLAWTTIEGIEPDVEMGDPIEYIWDKTHCKKLITLPESEGILPTRSSHQHAGSRAAYLKSLVSVIHRYRLGKRPG